MSNVRFYRLDTLPAFVDTKHQGIFVHVTTGDTTYNSGLWFGGAAGWEYLTNDTNAINAAIDAKIQELDVTGYAQAEMSTIETQTEKSSTLTIYGIKEDNGKIAKHTTSNFNVAIDGVYDRSTNKIATQSTVTNAIGNLKTTETIQAVTFNTAEIDGNTTLTFNGVKEENGVIAQGEGTSTFIVGDAKLKIQIGSNENEAFEVFSANAKENKVIQLNGDVFKKDGNVISVITSTPVASDNKLVTQKDVASINGAMHYKGTVSSLEEFNNKLGDSDVEEAGDVYIATGIPEGSFTDNKGNVIENGDMIVFNGAGEYTVVQSNLTLGTKGGQIAENDGDLAKDEIVIASENGIKTSGFKLDNASSRVIGVSDLAESETVHGTKVSDTLTVFGKNRNASLTINSNNESIEITGSNTDNDATITVDLVWNTTIE